MQKSQRVLIVEDEVLIRMLAVDMLLDLGYESDEAGTAAEALEKLRAPGAQFGIVFLDIGLPDKKGDDLIKEIREFLGQIPLVVASGEDKGALQARLAHFAPIIFLSKPYDVERLSEAISAANGA